MPPPPAATEAFAAIADWIEPADVDSDAVAHLTGELNLPPTLCRLLVARGLADPEAAKAFLRPRPGHLHPPALLRSMDAAARRIAAAVSGGEVILVHGDYDVDGICGAALLTRALRMMGGRVVPFVPDRITNGYDLRDAGVDAAVRAGASLIVTVDCGIVAHDAVDAARAAGIDVVVTDHHTPSDRLPGALAVVNPNRTDCDYPEKGLAGAGVAYKTALAVAQVRGFPLERLTALVDLVAIATIADLVPLRPENRSLVRWGLSVLPRTPNPGLRALLRTSGLWDRPEVTAGQIGFTLAPRLNAVGRVGDPMVALRLLLTDDPKEASDLAGLLEGENRRRQELDQKTLDEAMALLAESYLPDRDRGVVLASEGWHPGVIGIVASRIVERIHRPTFLIAIGDDEARGSGRSIPGFHLHAALVECGEHVLRFGGHRAAAGCSLLPGNVDRFRAAFNDAAHRQMAPDDLAPKLRIDSRITLEEATPEAIGLLRHFAPFGIGNPTPVFATSGVRMRRPKSVGRGHLRVDLEAGDATLQGIAFDMADRTPEIEEHSGSFDVAYRLERNEWRGRDGHMRRTIQARIVDFRPQ